MNQGQFNALLFALERQNALLAQLLAALNDAPKPAAAPKPSKAKAKAKPKPGDGVAVA